MNAPLKKMPVTRHTVHSGRVKLAAYTRGNPEHTPIVLVHGYPDDHSVWDGVAEHLAQKYFVLSYDVRGAGASSRPRQVSAYRLEALSDDLVATLDQLLPGRAVHLVGHDWGSVQTWESVTAAHLQYRILSYTTISGPSLDHAGHWMRDRLLSFSAEPTKQALQQLASSWYILAFQLPLLAPALWRLAGRHLPTLLAKIENIPLHLRPTQTQDGIFGINLYRANFIKSLLTPRERYTSKPVQLIVPLRDNYISPQIFRGLTRWAPNLWRRDSDAGHWGLLAESEKLAGWIADFIAQVDTGKAAPGLQKVSAITA